MSQTSSTPPTAPTAARARAWAAGALLVGAPLLVVLLWAGYADSVPDPLPRHWNAAGEVDGTTSVRTMTLLSGIVAAAAAAVGTAALGMRAHLTVAAEVVLGAGWVGWLMTSVYLTVMLNAEGAASADDVTLSYLWTAVVVLLPAALAWLLWRLVRGTGARRPAPATPASSLTISEQERVVWVGRASSRVLLLIAGALVLAGTALASWVQREALVLVGVGVLLGLMHRLTVRVDREAVTVRWGPVPLIRHRRPLTSIVAARAEHVEPMRWGGWGYRISARGRAAVVRRGPGLVLTLDTGSEFAVTVDRPEEAAELVNALLASRAGTSA
ncbi:DUF1648 domain-containing protein [Nocardioides campestrisoli]|uniref:DUF1648 domain-containing protein n=1 Tax=Nocardioides campestrisoli TaxID=2736757 RepID=UPI0015E6BB78|nr:DUF1648 domain-containing protein [Nocardioides campestrisoli]